MTPRERLWVALDTADPAVALDSAKLLAEWVGGFKVGLELFTRGGPQVVESIRATGSLVFLDLKLHDIPNTVAGAAAAAARLGASFVTLHALGGAQMLRRAAEASAEAARVHGLAPPALLAVTVLTSHDDAQLQRIGLAGPCRAAVLRLASLALDAGLDGVVCSALEARAVRQILPRATLVVPGIRRRSAAAQLAGDDQKRVATPTEALARGADLLVVGRPITQAPDPLAAAAAFVDEIEAAASPGPSPPSGSGDASSCA